MADYIKGDFDIAIIGMACRFPGADNVSEYWNNIISAKDCITRIENDDSKNYVGAFGRINNIYDFDYSFFGITKEEACMMDPQQRIFMQTVYLALKDSEYFGKNRNISLFAGSDEFRYVWSRICQDGFSEKEYDKRSLMLSGSLVSNISYRLDFQGAGITMRTACSTSLTAVHYGMSSLLNYECDICVAGGVSIIDAQEGYSISENSLSTDGYTRSFDKNCTGFVPGNGSGAVVLKRLEDAVEDNDRIYAVIRGSAVTNDGNAKAGYTAPGIKGIATAIKNAYDVSGISPDDVGYVECHGTATMIGDAVEIQALDKVFSSGRKTKCRIGSVKSNIGHTNMASGIASLIKTAMMVKNGVFAPSLYCVEENDCFKTARHVEVSKECKPWESSRRIAGVTSFGIGGTNCHMIIENYDDNRICRKNSCGIWFITADSMKQLECDLSLAKEYYKSKKEFSYNSITYTSLKRQKAGRYRTFAILEDNSFIQWDQSIDTDDLEHEKIILRVNDLMDVDESEISELSKLSSAFGKLYKNILDTAYRYDEHDKQGKTGVNMVFYGAYIRTVAEMIKDIDICVEALSGIDYLSGEQMMIDNRMYEQYCGAVKCGKTFENIEEVLVLDITPSGGSYAGDLCRAAGILWANGIENNGRFLNEITADAMVTPLPFKFANEEYCYEEIIRNDNHNTDF